MVDFRKRLTKKDSQNPIDPIALYETLDRVSDKGPLRPAQAAILQSWHEEHRSKRDVILKLHTGQGKTLIGLLILQSKLNEDGGPVVYLCANNFLVNQTCNQAKQFGVSFCLIENGLPADFLDGKSILITSVQTLFNGLTKFGIGQQTISVSSILMDDAHACIDSIRDSLRIRIEYNESAYSEIRNLFSASLENQGAGTYADICNNKKDALMLVPYWDWQDKHTEVVEVLARYTNHNSVKYVWPLIKNILADCRCVISGTALEIEPYLPPLHLFGTYHKAKHRVFMSATVSNDSFLMKGLAISAETIKDPLVYKDEKWSGEKMVLIPSLIDDSLNRSTIVAMFAKSQENRGFGVVALSPSFNATADWKAYGAIVATKKTIDVEIDKLSKGDYQNTLVIANRYDGIDLPDKMCRILIFDSKPYAERLIDRYMESCQANNEVTAMRTARTIEQGLGRSVRGEKDYCVMIMIGTNLIRSIRTKDSRKHLSNQTRTQVEIGLEIAEMAREEIENGATPVKALVNLINQCLKRDPNWKAFYGQEMDLITPSTPDYRVLDLFQLEFDAEKKFQNGDAEGAIQSLQMLVDKYVNDDSDKGWYLQEMARYKYSQNKAESNKLQITAHRKNRFLLRPRSGMQVDKIKVISQKRMENVIAWIKGFESYEELSVTLEDILSNISFGVKADRFEEAFDSLATALGFVGQRPDKEWREGPDNLWGLKDGEFLLVECKSEDKLTRAEINQSETEQMNRSTAWFAKYYQNAKAKNIMIIPTNKVGSAAAFISDVEVMRKRELAKFTDNVRKFFAEFKGMDFKDLSESKVQELINTHRLSVEALLTDYSIPVRPWK